MGIIIDENTQAIVWGITGTQGSFHTKLMLEYGTKIVAGVTPGKGGATVHGVPVYDTGEEALKEHPANAGIIFVPAPFASDAVLEALENGIKILVVITERIPIKDSIIMIERARRLDSIIIGPNTPGIITPGKSRLGIMPSHIFKPGNVGIISRSGTLTYEIAAGLSMKNLGQSTCIGLGGDPITGLNFIDVLEMFKKDQQTEVVVMIGEIGGNLEELAADYVAEVNYPKPVVAYIAGRTAPPGKRMGHAGAIIMGGEGTADSKIEALKNAGIKVAEKPGDVAKLVTDCLHEKC
jgi:succinyl-CoA synthetase alpha subunit